MCKTVKMKFGLRARNFRICIDHVLSMYLRGRVGFVATHFTNFIKTRLRVKT